jgi:hypothetical protein
MKKNIVQEFDDILIVNFEPKDNSQSKIFLEKKETKKSLKNEGKNFLNIDSDEGRRELKKETKKRLKNEGKNFN